MSTKKAVWVFVFVGSIVGGYIPVLLFNSSFLSLSSLLGSGIGSIIGIWIGLKIGKD